MARLEIERPEMTLDLDTLKQVVREVITTRTDEIGCQECFEQLDRFVEMSLFGRGAAKAMPLVQDHLDHCRDCREEFEALLSILRHMA
jgi:hypothetical protein